MYMHRKSTGILRRRLAKAIIASAGKDEELRSALADIYSRAGYDTLAILVLDATPEQLVAHARNVLEE